MKLYVDPEVIVYGAVFETVTAEDDLPPGGSGGGGVEWDE